MRGNVLRFVWAFCALLLGLLGFAGVANASSCAIATAQGTTGPAAWQTYCWIDLSAYDDTNARTASGQNFSLTLDDGTVMSFNMKVTTPNALTAIGAPSWSGAAIGNTAFLGITGKPVLYQTGVGTSTVVISGILLTPPAGAGGATAYMMIAADGESTNNGETLSFATNGGNWLLLDQAGPISGSTYPTATGTGTATFTETGVAGTVGAYIMGSNTPTTLTTTLVAGGLQGAMFAVRFAALRLATVITGTRAVAADQFTSAILATANSAVLSSGATSGSGLGPFYSASVSTSAAVPLTVQESMAPGSTDTVAHYRSVLSCVNATAGSSTVMPSGVMTISYALPSLQFGDLLQCTFTETPYPHLTLTKALAASGRQFTGDQFIIGINQGATGIASVTTGGTGATLTTATTGQFQVTAGTAYTFGEQPAGTTVMAQYTSTMGCINSYAASTTTLPTTVSGSITPLIGDVVACTITNTKVAANASLTVLKSSTIISDPVNGTTNARFIPGAIVRYTFTVANSGPSAVDNNTVLLIDALPSQLSVGTAASPSFAQGSQTSGLTFTAGTDIAYSNSATAPTTYAGCTYTPVAAYDPAVRFICINPKGVMAGSNGTAPGFTLSIQASIK